MTLQERYIFVKPEDKELINAVYRILLRCSVMLARHFLFHWIPPYSRSAIRRDCLSKFVVITKDASRDVYTSTFQMQKCDDGSLFVGKIATDPKFEGQGIGKANMLFMERFAREKGCKSVRLDVYVRSSRAIQFYEESGFEIIGTKRSIRFKLYKMEKKL